VTTTHDRMAARKLFQKTAGHNEGGVGSVGCSAECRELNALYFGPAQVCGCLRALDQEPSSRPRSQRGISMVLIEDIQGAESGIRFPCIAHGLLGADSRYFQLLGYLFLSFGPSRK
jgi:hypothetical protein